MAWTRRLRVVNRPGHMVEAVVRLTLDLTAPEDIRLLAALRASAACGHSWLAAAVHEDLRCQAIQTHPGGRPRKLPLDSPA